ncbi:MAG: pilin [bacterium]
MKKIYLTICLMILILGAIGLAKVSPTQAQSSRNICVWTTIGNCNEWGSVWQGENDSVCMQPKPKLGTGQKCCCPVACCRYVDGNGMAQSTSAMDSTECRAKIRLVSGAQFNGFDLYKYPNGMNGCDDTPMPDIDNRGVATAPPKNKADIGVSQGGGGGNGGVGGGGGNGGQGGGGGNAYDSYPNPLNTTDFRVIIGRVIRAILVIVGALALMMFVYGGFTWLTSAGNDQRVETGRNTLIWASLGLIIVFSAYVLVKYVLEAIGAV